MSIYLKYLIAGLTIAFTAGYAFAADHGTADEAVALVKKTVVFLKENGQEKAFAEINKQEGTFRNKDLYIFVNDLNGHLLAHGANPKMVGKDMIELRDADGKPFIKAFNEVAKTKGAGWVDYKWVNPVTKVIEQKSTYVERAGDLLVGCGIYK